MTKAPDPTDQYVGSRLRLRRRMLGMSQETLARSIGLTFQQVQKYEKGLNRVSASRLQQVAQALRIPVSFFFDGAPGASLAGPMRAVAMPDDALRFIATTEGLALAQAFMRISSKRVKRNIVDLVKQIASNQ